MGVVEFLREEKFLMEDQFRAILKPHKRNAYLDLGRSNITVLYGLRGVGKTTLLAQKYFEVQNAIAIHGEHLALNGFSIKDLIANLKHFPSIEYLFLDEITTFSSWPAEVKVLSDLHPKLKIVITGSSAVNLQQARQTLARRAVFVNLKPLTFNEFLTFSEKPIIEPFNLEAVDVYSSALKVEFDAREKRLDLPALLEQYKHANLPYLMESPASTLLDVLHRVIYEDIAHAGNFSDEITQMFLPLIKLLALSEKTSLDVLSRDLKVGKGTVIKMIDFLTKANLILPVLPYAFGKAKVRKEPKYLFSSPAIRSVVLKLIGEKEREAGLTREDLFAMHAEGVFYLKDGGPDFVWRNCMFEIGGPSKTAAQFKNVNFKGKKFIVHEGTELSMQNEVVKLPFYIYLSQF